MELLFVFILLVCLSIEYFHCILFWGIAAPDIIESGLENCRKFLPAPYHLNSTQNLKPNIVLDFDFIFAYGCRNLEEIVIYSRFRYPIGYFCTSFKLLDDCIRKWVMSSRFLYMVWCVVNGVEGWDSELIYFCLWILIY